MRGLRFYNTNIPGQIIKHLLGGFKVVTFREGSFSTLSIFNFILNYFNNGTGKLVNCSNSNTAIPL